MSVNEPKFVVCFMNCIRGLEKHLFHTIIPEITAILGTIWCNITAITGKFTAFAIVFARPICLCFLPVSTPIGLENGPQSGKI